jgi:putative cardiolipin synthase
MRARGVSIRALTNSLASNDVTANHAAYARRRAQIVASGADVYELRPMPPVRTLVTIGDCSLQRIFGLPQVVRLRRHDVASLDNLKCAQHT